MRLTHAHVRTQMMQALLCFSQAEGRTDDQTCIGFDNMSAYFEGTCFCREDEVGPPEEAIGHYLVRREERDALIAAASRYEELSVLTKRGDELAFLSHPHYGEFARASQFAFDVMASSSPESPSCGPLTELDRRPGLMAAVLTLQDIERDLMSAGLFPEIIGTLKPVFGDVADPNSTAVGRYLFLDEERRALQALSVALEELFRRAGTRPEVCLMHPSYPEFGFVARAAFDAMATAVSEPPE